MSLEDYLERVERELIREALDATRWNRTEAARRLGMTFRALRYRLQKLGLD
jgi:two-component system response regulator PilR (NtrC family)